jgi:uncharacterized protein (DUF58 family)
MTRSWYYLGLAVSAGGILLRQPLLLISGLLALAILLVSDIWASCCLLGLRYRRQLSESRVLFGEEITLSFSIENAKLLPLPWVEVEETIPATLLFQGRRPRVSMSGERAIVESLFSPRWYERITRHYRVRCLARGVHTFGPTRLRTGDVFGLVSREVQLANWQYLLVYPLVVPLMRFGLPARHPFGDQRAPRRLLEDPARVSGIRDYRYGDELRRVHWKASARAMRLQSKVYEATTTYTLALFLNVLPRLDTQVFSVHPELQELAICAAASICAWALNEGYAIGLYANTMLYQPETDSLPLPGGAGFRAGDALRRCVRLPPASGEEQRRRLMEALARIESFYGVSIEEVLRAERRHLPVGATVVLITSAVSEDLLDALTQLRRGGHSVNVLYVGSGPQPARLPGINCLHIGGEETWRALEALYAGDGQREEAAAEAGRELRASLRL